MMPYIKQLNSLRAIAVILVIISHWYTPDSSAISAWLNVIGGTGVTVFFVLSGFLITRILLHQRSTAEETGLSTNRIIKHFYIRRALRIFPVYYLFVFCICAFDYYTKGHPGPDILYYITYTANYCYTDMSAGHLWSLSVEEQFYLLWPWLILFVKESRLMYMILLFTLLGIVSEYVLHAIPGHAYFTICCFDAFGTGAMLAWLVLNKPQQLSSITRYAGYAALLSSALIISGVFIPSSNLIPLRIKGTCIAFYTILYLYQVHNTKKYPMQWLFSNSGMMYIGKISYGMYLFHLSIPFVWKYIPEKVYGSFPAYLSHEGVWIVNGLLLLTIASISYYILEKPFLNLKEHYN